METKMKQRVAGIIILLLLIFAISFLLFFVLKRGDQKIEPSSAEQTLVMTDKTELQLELPNKPGASKSDVEQKQVNAPQISQVPQDVILKSNQKTELHDVSNQLVQLTSKPNEIANNKDNLVSDDAGVEKFSDAVKKSQNLAPNQSVQNGEIINQNAHVDVQDDIKKFQDEVEANNVSENIDANKIVDESIIKEPSNAVANETLVEKNEPVSSAKAVKNPVQKKTEVAPSVNKAFSKVGNWSIKVGTFSIPPHADVLVNKLRKSGYNVSTQLLMTQNDGILTQVFVGPSQTKSQAFQLAMELKKKFGVKCVILNVSTKHKRKVTKK